MHPAEYDEQLGRDPPENAKGGGGKTGGGGGAKPHKETPHGKQFPTPHLGTVPSPHCHCSYKTPYKLPEFLSGHPLKNSVRRVSKNGIQGAILARFCPHPLFCRELQIPCIKEFLWRGGTLWDLSLPVTLTLWDTPVLCTPPLPLSQIWVNAPSATKLLLTKKMSEIFIFEKLQITHAISWKTRSFSEISRTQNSSKITKNNSQGIIFGIISRQRVLTCCTGNRHCDSNGDLNRGSNHRSRAVF